MSEYIISDKCLEAIRRKCYQAGLTAQEIYTVRGADGEEIVRCRDCKRFNRNETCALFDDAFIEPDGFCKWGERRD